MASHLFTPVDKKNRIYRVKSIARAKRYLPSLPSGPLPRVSGALTSKVPTNKRPVSLAEIHQRVLTQ